MLKITEQMYLKTFEFEKRKVANAIIKNMEPMMYIIPHLYSLVDREVIPLTEEERQVANGTPGFNEYTRAIKALTWEESDTYMAEPQRRVRMTFLVVEYFLRTYK